MSPRHPLLDPQGYFDAYADPFNPALAIFALYVTGPMAVLYATVNPFLSRVRDIPPGAEAAVFDVLGTITVFYIGIEIVSLQIVAGIMHILVGSDATGSYRDAVAVVGWAYAPDIISLPFGYLRAWVELRDRTFDGTDAGALAAEIEAIDDPTGLLDVVLLLFFVAWSVYILARGTAATHDVEVGRTIGPVLLVGFGAILFRMV